MPSAVDSLVVLAAHDEAKYFYHRTGPKNEVMASIHNTTSLAGMQTELVAPDLSNFRPLYGCQTCARGSRDGLRVLDTP